MSVHVAEASGAPRVLMDMARACRDAEWNVTIVMPGVSPFDDEILEAGMNLHHIPHPMGPLPLWAPSKVPGAMLKRLAYYRGWRRWLQGRSFDIAYISASVEVLRGLACAKAGLPICWHVHEDLPSPPPWLLKRKLALIKRRSRMILYAAEACRQAFKPVPSNVLEHVLWNGIELNKFQNPPDGQRRRQIRQELGVGEEEWLICTAAFAQPRKGIDVAAAAMQIIRDQLGGRLDKSVQWLVLGDWHEAYPEYRNEVESQIREAGIHDVFRVVGFRRNLPEVMAAADAFVLPSRNEAMPLVLCEAMAAGLPAISTETGDVRAMLRNGELGWLAPVENPAALAQTIVEALTNDDERGRRADAARRRAFEEFSLDAMKKKFIALMEEHFLKSRA